LAFAKKGFSIAKCIPQRKDFQAIIFDYPGMAHRGFGGHLVILW